MNIKEAVGSRHFPPQCVFIAIYNLETEELSIPRGNQTVNEGDELFLVATTENIKKAADFLTAKHKH
ncbi:MAG: hypothetical protein JW715_15405 [Sedimentisphaerales bacterium]|nr:hypothetical protein [Sedimentisphaerales bacterium]